jgi:hypothetical protein
VKSDGAPRSVVTSRPTVRGWTGFGLHHAVLIGSFARRDGDHVREDGRGRVVGANGGRGSRLLATGQGGHLVYVPSAGSEDIAAFRVGPDGRPQRVGDSIPTGAQLFTFAIAADSTLAPTSPPLFTGGTDSMFQSLAVQPNQGPTAALIVRTRPAGSTTRFDAFAIRFGLSGRQVRLGLRRRNRPARRRP